MVKLSAFLISSATYIYSFLFVSFFMILSIITAAINAVTTSEHACDTKTPVYPNTFDMIKVLIHRSHPVC